MSKKAISAKLDEELLIQTDQLARKLGVARNRAMEDGLRLWVKQKLNEILATEMKKASLQTRKESHAMEKDWSSTLQDGLSDLLIERPGDHPSEDE